jgi:hypothetical protein
MDKNVTQGVRLVEEKDNRELEKKRKNIQAEPLPFCTNAPNSEHRKRHGG